MNAQLLGNNICAPTAKHAIGQAIGQERQAASWALRSFDYISSRFRDLLAIIVDTFQLVLSMAMKQLRVTGCCAALG